jgi:ATP-dependent RNA helicase RhlE
MREPKLVEVSPRGRAAAMVEQMAYTVSAESKTALLLDLLERERELESFERVLVFTRTRRAAERLSHILEAREHKVNRIHADRTQPQREAALRGFKEGRTRVLVATDIAARGLDVESVSHVINYDVPVEPEAYVHRIGRTGRAGKVGRAITLVTPVEELSMRAIERLTGQAVERVVLPGFGGTTRAGAATVSSGVASGVASGAASASVVAKPFRALRRSGSSSRRSFKPRRAGR